MDDLALKYNVKEPKDWGKVKILHVRDSGGGSLLKNYFNDSLFACLRSIYKGFQFSLFTFIYSLLDVTWKREWFSSLPRFPKSHWES